MITTDEKIQLVKYIAEGYTSKSIALLTKRNPRTIEFYIAELKEQYGAVNIPNLVHIFHKMKIL